MKFILPLLFMALVGLSSAPALVPRVAGDKQIQGTWHFEGNDGGGHSWYLEWTFEQGKFTLKGYPPLYQEGSYRIIKSVGDKLTLELYDQKGNFGTENSQIEIVTGKNRNKLRQIKGQGPFSRVKATQ
ncbi:MAG TPA: hypothetical protein VM095_18995 [Pyrinomonadaceae bacterium]|nr:hypothetical protein [Pyrinomonadaceae bacterium]